MVSGDGYPSEVGVRLVQLEFADNRCVDYVLASVQQGVNVVDNMEGVGCMDLFADVLGPDANALAQAAHLVGVQSGPYGRKAWVFAELVVGEVLTSLVVEDSYRSHTEERLGEDAARR